MLAEGMNVQGRSRTSSACPAVLLEPANDKHVNRSSKTKLCPSSNGTALF